MKNINLLSLAIINLAIMLSFITCQKDKDMTNSTNNEIEFMSSGNTVEADILNFIERIDLVRENPEYEGSDEWNYSFEESIYYTEAALNYRFAYPHEQRSKLLFDSINFNIETSGSDLNIIVLKDLFDNTLDSLENVYLNINAETKGFAALNTEYKYTDGVLKVSMYHYFFTKNDLPEGENWYWGNELGTCSGSYIGYDAADKIMQSVYNANIDVHSHPIFPTYYSFIDGWNYSDFHTGNYSPQTAGVHFYEEREYYNPSNVTWPDCIYFHSMDLFTKNAVSSIDNIHNQFPSKKLFIEDIRDFEIPESYNPSTNKYKRIKTHDYNAMIATPNIRYHTSPPERSYSLISYTPNN